MNKKKETLVAGTIQHLEGFVNNNLHITHEIHCQFNIGDFPCSFSGVDLKNIKFWNGELIIKRSTDNMVVLDDE